MINLNSTFILNVKNWESSTFSFTDDLLLMLSTRGDVISIQMIMRQFEDFSKANGLVANKAKYKVFFGGVGSKMLDKILQRKNWLWKGVRDL